MTSRLEEIIEDAERTGEPWIIQRDGEPIAVLCSPDTWRRLTEESACR